jgi:hypothetical protein
MVMNRTDKDFHGVDANTSRPYSGGHPDGVWLIGIVYTLLSLIIGFSAATGMVGTSLITSGGRGTMWLSMLSICLYVLTIILLFKRSAIAVFATVVITIFSILALVLTFLFNKEILISAVVLTAINSYIFYYVFGLKSDHLLN